MRGRWLGAAVTLACVLAASCSGSPAPETSSPSPGATVTARPVPGTSARWSGLAACREAEHTAYECGTLTVPLDRVPGSPDTDDTLDLPVLVAGKPDAPRTLLFLTGGPGQPGAGMATRVLPSLSAVADRYRIVLVDQRGTGADALDCPDLQAQLGMSDLEVPSEGAVRACGNRLGPSRAQYSTAATVADLDDLRRALGVRSWSIDGVSYGSYVAARYAAAHPGHVDRLVLDSVVPVTGFDARMTDVYPDVARVLRSACRARACEGDPAQEIHTVVARSPDLGPALLDVVSLMSVVQPDFAPLFAPLHAAAGGDDGDEGDEGDEGALRALVRGWQDGSSGPAQQLSSGLHAATLCLDLDFPWGGADSPPARRAAAVEDSVAGLPAGRLWPFDAGTARGNGVMRTCQWWPRTADPAAPPAQLRVRGVDTLLLAGARDLSTPVAWARRAHRQIAGSRLVVIPRAGHATQARSTHARDVVADFLE